jgi:hypothetical protein
MSARHVHYICRAHGEFTAHVRCGFGAGPAPVQMVCPVPACDRLADRKRVAQVRQRRDARRSVSVSTTVYERLRQHCDAHGISMEQWIDAHTQELEL